MYDASILNKVKNTQKQKQNTERVKWEKFTYVGKEKKFITKIRDIDRLKINTIYLVSNQITCSTCNMKYTG